MLETVTVKNLALIDRLEVQLRPGLNVITGPTGSGKTLLIDALKLALGERADYELLSDEETEARITATFRELDSPPPFPSFDGDRELLLRRVLKPDHTSPAYLNDERVRLKTLQEGRREMIDFHGQHENQAVFRDAFPREVLDRFGDYEEVLRTYRDRYEEFSSLRSEIEELSRQDSDHNQRLQLLNYQLGELDDFDPGEDEWEQIEQRRREMEAAEEIDRSLRESVGVLESDDSPAAQLQRIQRQLQSIDTGNETLEDWVDELADIQSRLEEMRHQLREQREGLSHSEREFEELMDRRGRWMELSRKHNVPPESLSSHYRNLSEERDRLENRDRRREEIRKELDECESKLRNAADELRDRRIGAAEELEEKIETRLERLNLEDGRFRIEITDRDPGPHGADRVQWLFASHSSQGVGPLSSRVSGGEISRVLLAVKAALAEADTTPVLVFDEIDTGISGEEADSVGRVLSELARYHQVLCITHLPLVASHADHHVQITREDTPNEVKIRARSLDRESRIDEMSRLLSGDRESEVSREQARELLEKR